MAPRASTQCGVLPPNHQRIGSCTSNGIDSEQVPGTVSVLTISSLPSQPSAQRAKRFLGPLLGFSDAPSTEADIYSSRYREATRGAFLI